MATPHVLAKYSQFIENLVDSGYDGNLSTLFADLDITEISVDDFICIIAILPHFDGDDELVRRATMRVSQYRNSRIVELLSKTIEYATIMQKLYNSMPPCEIVELDCCESDNDTITKAIRTNDIDTDTDTETTDSHNNIVSNNYNLIVSEIKKIEKRIALKLEKTTQHQTTIDIKDLDIEYRTFTRIIRELLKKFDNRGDVVRNYILHIGIENFLSACDKLKLNQQIYNVIIGLNMKLQTPMQQSVINHEFCMRDNIVTIFDNGYRLIYNNTVTMLDVDDKFCRAIKNGLSITKLTKCDSCEIGKILDKSLCNNLHTLQLVDKIQYNYGDYYTNKIQSQLQLDKFPPLTSFDISKYKKDTINICIKNMHSLRELNCCGCNINDINFFPASLHTLCINYTRLPQRCITKCTSIVKLICNNNKCITSCESFAKSLRILSIENICSIECKGLIGCVNIEKLNCMGNSKITTCAPFASSLRVLICSFSNAITDKGIEGCAYIEELDCSKNKNITTCKPFAASLRILICNYCNIRDNGLAKCTNIETLECSHTELITTCVPFCKSLCILAACNSNITDNGIAKCSNIHSIEFNRNSKITSCMPFIRSLRNLYCDDKSIIAKMQAYRDKVGITIGLNLKNKYTDCNVEYSNLHKYFQFSTNDNNL